MRFIPTLLRLILALSLVLNGTGLAAAHAGKAEMHDTAAAGVGVAPADEAPCHRALERSETSHESHASNGEGKAAKAVMIDHQAGTDCCDMGTCDNACPQPLSAALVAAVIIALHARPEAHTQAMPATRAAPPLPHPIRPPIA